MTVKTILVYVGVDAVGDGLMKLPFLRALRHAYPQARITWLAGKGPSIYGAGLAPLVAGLVDEVIDRAALDAEIGSRLGELVGARPLGGRRFDLIIDTQRRLLTSLILRRIPHGRLVSSAGNRTKDKSLVGQLLALVEQASGKPAETGAALALTDDVLAEAARLLPLGGIYVGLAPGAGGRQKCWPLDRYMELGRILARRGIVPVVLLGPAETEWAADIRAALPQAVLPLQDSAIGTPMLTIALGQRLAAAVANDAGVGHMLAAADVPLVSLFGPTSPEKFAPAAKLRRVLTAQDFGSDSMDAIPTAAVERALAEITPDLPGPPNEGGF